ncbi:MAG: PKD domain-containing protein, partial [Actinobacteria bacterium]
RLTLQGTPAARLVLQPGGAANWQIDAQGAFEIAGLDVRGSTNLALARIRAAATGSLDGGGNTGWNFHQPVLTTAAANATEDAPALITLGATDGDGDSLSCAITSLPAHGKLYQVNPDGTRGGQIDAPGTPVTHSARQVIYLFELDGDAADSFDYAVSDGQYPVTGAVALSRTNRNDPPHAVPDSYNLIEDSPLLVSALAGVLANDSDEDGPSLQALLVDAPAHGQVTLQPDGAFTYTPALNYNGSDSFSYHASDDSSTALALVTLTIQAVDDAPAAHIELSGTRKEGEALTFTASLVDPDDGTSWEFSKGFVANWSFGDGGSTAGAQVSHTFANDGSYTVTLSVDDPTHGTSSQALE